MGKPYRPSNGTEGGYFMSKYCERCANDMNEDCVILALTFAYEIGDSEYPAEWVQDDDWKNPRCTAFKEASDE